LATVRTSICTAKCFGYGRPKSAYYGPEFFVRHEDASLASTAAECLTERHQLADWSRKSIYIGSVEDQLSNHVHECLLRFKEHRLEDRIRESVAELSALTDPDAREAKLAEFMRISSIAQCP